ncbi:MAG TPA: proton-conducting transporter membrane subunit [Bryobacteraceae bacterium]|jgi:hydrogenase-4 component F
MILITILVVPLIAVAISWIPITARFAAAATLLSSLAVLGMAVYGSLQVLSGGPVVAIQDWIVLDGLSALILLLVAIVGTTATIFSWGYIARVTHGIRKIRVYYANYNLFLFSMLAVPVFVQPNLVWTAVELTTLFSVLLVSFENTREALEAAWKYIVLTLMGAAIALLGFLVLYWAMRMAGTGTYTWASLSTAAPVLNAHLLKVAILLILVGFGVKVGLVPLHTWLPDAHSQAPSPVCALLSGVETTVVLYTILRLAPVMRAAPGLDVRHWAIALGLLSTGVAAFLLLRVQDYKRLFAFSTVEHMGIVLTAVGLGGSDAYYGAMYQMMSHALTKSFCFYAAGATLLMAGTREIASVRGLIRTSPLAGAALLLGGLAIAGAPPFAVFLSEFSIFRAGISQGRYLVTGLLVLFVVIAFFGILLHINRMVFGVPEGSVLDTKGLPATCSLSLALAAIPVVVLGLALPGPVDALLRAAASRP